MPSKKELRCSKEISPVTFANIHTYFPLNIPLNKNIKRSLCLEKKLRPITHADQWWHLLNPECHPRNIDTLLSFPSLLMHIPFQKHINQILHYFPTTTSSVPPPVPLENTSDHFFGNLANSFLEQSSIYPTPKSIPHLSMDRRRPTRTRNQLLHDPPRTYTTFSITHLMLTFACWRSVLWSATIDPKTWKMVKPLSNQPVS